MVGGVGCGAGAHMDWDWIVGRIRHINRESVLGADRRIQECPPPDSELQSKGE